jgi:hypothetical protein
MRAFDHYKDKANEQKLQSDGKPECSLKLDFARLVTKDALRHEGARASTDKTKEKQIVFRDTPAPILSLRFVQSICRQRDRVHPGEIDRYPELYFDRHWPASRCQHAASTLSNYYHGAR